jgi:anti-anti-sigma factor
MTRDDAMTHERAMPPRRVESGPGAITISSDHGAVVAAIDGELDVSNIGIVHHVIVDSMQDGSRYLILDLSSARYIDSSATAMVLRISNEMATHRRAFSVVAPEGSRARRVFHFTGIESDLDLHDDVAAALKSVSSMTD